MATPTPLAARRPIGFWLGMPLLMFGANFVWVSYHSILLLPMVQGIVPPDRASIRAGLSLGAF